MYISNDPQIKELQEKVLSLSKGKREQSEEENPADFFMTILTNNGKTQ